MDENPVHTEAPSRQEMFDRAFRGLRGQGFEMCGSRVSCLYEDPSTDRRCAWGHVDTTLHERDWGSVNHLHSEGIGVAAQLGVDDLSFAQQLQRCHDGSRNPAEMESLLRDLASRYGLTVPG